MPIENHIRVFRAKEGLTQEDLAKKVEVTRQTIISLEKGSYTPSLELAFKLSEIFEVSIEEIFYQVEDAK
ncbi:helix-turn-helix transcriptional regulator [Proteiniclasticum sp.]|uniref:helix-turn-helix transcriptional regulator n=1 Tax=Proteiniclasticum sp. TaxID=2053595 RepID=UPI0028977B32|nr:helix-turn-helix transcriptional regulator [Proteiniclasticum sp.]